MSGRLIQTFCFPSKLITKNNPKYPSTQLLPLHLSEPLTLILGSSTAIYDYLRKKNWVRIRKNKGFLIMISGIRVAWRQSKRAKNSNNPPTLLWHPKKQNLSSKSSFRSGGDVISVFKKTLKSSCGQISLKIDYSPIKSTLGHFAPT